MNIEELISKYLDGELNRHEDTCLRELISESKENRDIFYSAVEVHLALKDDARKIEVPSDLLSKTEDMILMNIMGKVPRLAEPETGEKAPRVFSLRTVSLVAASFLLFAFYNISELTRDISSSLSSPDETSALVLPENEASKLRPVTGSSKIAKPRPSVAYGSGDRVIAGLSSEAGEALQEGNESVPDRQEDVSLAVLSSSQEQAIEQAIEKEDAGTVPKTDDRRSYAQNESSLSFDQGFLADETSFQQNDIPAISTLDMGDFNSTNEFFNSKKISQVELASNYSNFVTRAGIIGESNARINNFSQSFAYVLQDNSKFGIEIGYSDINYDYSKKVKIPKGNVKPGSEENMITVNVKLQNDYQNYWTMLFYEKSILTFDNVSVTARGGVGFSNDGLLAGLRTGLNYKIAGGLHTGFGIEYRAFDISLPGVSSSGGLNNGGLMINYGFNYKF